VVKVIGDDLHVLSGSYVLDALSEPERDSFERHLQHCPLCQDEVRGLRETAARLGLAKTLDPPPQLRPRVLAAAYRTRQLPPPVGERIGPERRRARVTWRFAERPARRHAQRRVRVPRLAAALAAASVVVVAGLGITQAMTRHQPGGVPTASAAISRIVTAPDARTETERTSVGGTVTVVVSADRQAAVVSAAGMRSLPSAQTYQLWVISPHGARSAGLLSGTGQAGPVLASGVEPGDRIGITVEPAGGTSSPTTTPVIAVPV
jgi:Anti-sigma-K factor rskA/Putative zinc-finger